MAISKKNFVIDSYITMYLLVVILEVVITTWVIQWTWNNVLIQKLSKGTMEELTFWDAFLISVSFKLLIFGTSGLIDKLT